MQCPMCQQEMKIVRYRLVNEEWPNGIATVGQSCDTPGCPGNEVEKSQLKHAEKQP